ncbi:Malate dehydrogenase, mitochondrial, partial [Linum perenne]
MKVAWSLGIRKLNIQSDSRAAIEILKSEPRVSLQHWALVEEFHELCRRNWELAICHVYREANCAADYLANLGHFISFGFRFLMNPDSRLAYWLRFPPSSSLLRIGDGRAWDWRERGFVGRVLGGVGSGERAANWRAWDWRWESVPHRNVAILGTAGGIGQPLSLLMKLNPFVSNLVLYDISNTPDVSADVSHINTRSKGGVGSRERVTTVVRGIEEIGVCLVVGREEEMGWRWWWCWRCGGGDGSGGAVVVVVEV